MDEKKEKKPGIIARLKKVKHIEIIIAVIAVVIMLIIYFSGFIGKKSPSHTSSSDSASAAGFYSDYCERMNNELTQVVSKMDGAGKTKVLISWESSVELLLAYSENNSQNSSSKNLVILGNTQPIITKEIYPKAMGVVVICEGGSDARLKVSIIMSVAVLLDLTTDKIMVYPMTKK